jgi:hypothetical protein
MIDVERVGLAGGCHCASTLNDGEFKQSDQERPSHRQLGKADLREQAASKREGVSTKAILDFCERRLYAGKEGSAREAGWLFVLQWDSTGVIAMTSRTAGTDLSELM